MLLENRKPMYSTLDSSLKQNDTIKNNQKFINLMIVEDRFDSENDNPDSNPKKDQLLDEISFLRELLSEALAGTCRKF